LLNCRLAAEDDDLPLDVEEYLLSAKTCSLCGGPAFEQYKVFVTGFDAVNVAQTITLHHTLGSRVPVRWLLCSEACMQRKFPRPAS
jgi:hypothetical protein